VLLVLKKKTAGSLPQTNFLKKKLAVPVTLFPNSTLYKPQYLTAVFLLLASHKLEMSRCSTLFRLVHTLYMLQHFNLSGFSPQTNDVRMCSLPLLGMSSQTYPWASWHNFLPFESCCAVPGKFEEANPPPTFTLHSSITTYFTQWQQAFPQSPQTYVIIQLVCGDVTVLENRNPQIDAVRDAECSQLC